MPRSSKSFLFPDVNVWLALTYDRHVHHSAAKAWLEGVDTGARLCFCRFTQISFLRLLNTSAVMGEDGVLSQSRAWNAYDRWIEEGDAILLEEPAAIEPSFRVFSQQSRPAPKDWADSYLAAFASVLGLKLVSFDQSFRQRFRESIILRPVDVTDPLGGLRPTRPRTANPVPAAVAAQSSLRAAGRPLAGGLAKD
jgi:uncharacterized protein